MADFLERKQRHARFLAKAVWIFYLAAGVFSVIQPLAVLAFGPSGYLQKMFIAGHRLSSYPGCVPSCTIEGAVRYATELDHYKAYTRDATSYSYLGFFFAAIFLGVIAGRVTRPLRKWEIAAASAAAFYLVASYMYFFLSTIEYATVVNGTPAALPLANGAHPDQFEIVRYTAQRCLNQLSFGFLENLGFKMSGISPAGTLSSAVGLTGFDYLVPISVYGAWGFWKGCQRIADAIRKHLESISGD
jgi:hypothetical protein